MHGERLFLNSYEFISSDVNNEKYIQKNISITKINANVSNVLLVTEY